MAARRIRRIFTRFIIVATTAAIIVVGGLLFFDNRARQDDEVLVVEIPFSSDGFGATTIGRIIFINNDRAQDSELIAHELVHVCQWEEQGIEFLWDYSTEFVTNVVELGDLRDAYVEISFEEQAREGPPTCDLDLYVQPSISGEIEPLTGQ